MTKALSILRTVLLILTGIFITSCVFVNRMGLRINCSDSLPFCLFSQAPDDLHNLKYGDFISFQHRHSRIPCVKKIVGFPGDSLKIFENSIYINDNPYGKVKKKSPSGMNLTPITAEVIPEDYVFVHGNHEDSFDSRYEEFGLVNIKDVREILCPIF